MDVVVGCNIAPHQRCSGRVVLLHQLLRHLRPSLTLSAVLFAELSAQVPRSLQALVPHAKKQRLGDDGVVLQSYCLLCWCPHDSSRPHPSSTHRRLDVTGSTCVWL